MHVDDVAGTHLPGPMVRSSGTSSSLARRPGGGVIHGLLTQGTRQLPVNSPRANTRALECLMTQETRRLPMNLSRANALAKKQGIENKHSTDVELTSCVCASI